MGFFKKKKKRKINVLRFKCVNCNKDIGTVGAHFHIDNLCTCDNPKVINSIETLFI